jgi:hypothetical protein
MAEKGGVYVLDEPTTGLHMADLKQLLGLLDRLADSGKSVIVIKHHQAVMAQADWIIDSTSRPTSADDRDARSHRETRSLTSFGWESRQPGLARGSMRLYYVREKHCAEAPLRQDVRRETSDHGLVAERDAELRRCDLPHHDQGVASSP